MVIGPNPCFLAGCQLVLFFATRGLGSLHRVPPSELTPAAASPTLLVPGNSLTSSYLLPPVKESSLLLRAHRIDWACGDNVGKSLPTLRFVTLITGFPGGASDKEPACQCRRQERRMFDPWVGKIPWRRAWQPTPVFLPGKSPGQRSLASCSSWGRTVRHDLAHTHASLLHMSRQLRLTRHSRKACHMKNEHQEHNHEQDN